MQPRKAVKSAGSADQFAGVHARGEVHVGAALSMREPEAMPICPSVVR